MATQETQEILLNVRVNNSDALNNIVAYKNEIEKLREANKALAKDSKENKANEAANAKQIEANNEVIKKYSTTVRQLSKEIQNNIAQEKFKEGSLKGLRAELSNLTSAYDELSEAERNAASGVELRDKINRVTNQLKAAEESTQRYYRNVGNYENAIKNVFGDGIASKIGNVKAGIMGVKSASDMLATHPLLTIVFAIVTIFTKLKDALTNNEEQMNRLTQAMQPFSVVGDVVTRIVEKLAGALATGLEYLVKWTSKLADWVTGTDNASKAVERYIELEKERQQLVLDNRNLTVKTAEIENKVSELRAKVNDKESNTAKERLKALNEAITLERELAEERKIIAERELAVLIEEGERTKNSAEFNDKLAQAKVKVLQAETAYNNFLREAVAKQSELVKSIRDEETKLTEARVKLRERELKTLQEAEELMISLIKDEQTKEEREAEIAAEKKIDTLKKRLTEEKDLTITEIRALNEMIALEEYALQEKLKEIRTKYDTEKAENAEQEKLKELEDINAMMNARKEASAAELVDIQDLAEQEMEAKNAVAQSSIALLEEVAGENKAAAKAAKVLALGQILIENGKAIAMGVAQAMSVPFPANIAAVATTLATITATIASAKKTISAAKFAEGGLVTGEGTGTSDSIPAMLSNGESVINAQATALYSPLLSAINQSTGGAAIGAKTGELINYDALINGIAGAVANIRPVVSVQEINDVNARVGVIQNLAQN